MLRADWDGVIPITGPRPTAVQARAASARTLRFAGSGRGVDDGYALTVGQDPQRGGGLVFTQAGARALVLRAGRVAGERVFELREVRAERAGGFARLRRGA